MSTQKTPFLYIASLAGFSLLTFDLYQPALPYITNYFNTTHALGQLTLSLYLFIFGFSQLFWGPLIDHFGRRKCLSASLVIFLCGTLLCIFAVNIDTLIIGRIIQGLSVCCANVVAFSSTRDYEDSTKRARAISHISMVISASPIFAPLIGAVLFINFGWESNFIAMAFIALILFVYGYKVLKESPHWTAKTESFSLKTLLGAYKEILNHKQLWIGIVIITAAFSSIMTIVINAAYLIIDKLHFSPAQFSLFFACNGLTIIAGNYLGILLREHYSLLWNVRLGILVHLTGSLGMLFFIALKGFTIWAMAPSLLITFGVSLTSPPALSLALTDFKSHSGSAVAVINMARVCLSAVIAGLVGGFIAYQIYALPYTLIGISLVSILFSFYFKDNYNP